MNADDLCFVCRRRSCGFAVGVERRVGWLCDECKAPAYGKRAYAMTDRQFDAYEQRAILQGGDAAGAYLDRIGRTDLASLSPEEWRAFLGIFVTSFGSAIRDEVGRGAVQGWVEPPIAAHRNIDDEEAA